MDGENTRGGEVERVFVAHYDAVYRAVVGLVHEAAEARDLTQETFVKAYQALPHFRGEATLRTWLTRIAHNVVLDHFRRLARQREAGAVSLDDPDLETLSEARDLSQAQAAEQQESDACVQRCVSTLADDHRQAVVLHDMVGMTNQEIADMLGVSLATVKIRVHRGRAQLRSTVDRHCELYRDDRNVLACRHKRGKGGR